MIVYVKDTSCNLLLTATNNKYTVNLTEKKLAHV